MDGDTIVLTDIFRFEQTGIGEVGKVLGELKAIGIRPMFSARLEAAGHKLGAEIFGTSIADQLSSRQHRQEKTKRFPFSLQLGHVLSVT